jgi:hypothetical protein
LFPCTQEFPEDQPLCCEKVNRHTKGRAE